VIRSDMANVENDFFDRDYFPNQCRNELFLSVF